MSTYYMVLIDGTGPYDGEQYHRDFEFSFLHQIAKSLGHTRSAYFEGPGTLGLTTLSKANAALQALHTRREQNRSCKLFIAGYSRGGAAAMELAKMAAYYSPDPDDYGIPTETIPIEAIFLLDPVSKDFLCSGGGITSNVKKTYVMYRDQNIWNYSPKLRTEDFASYTDKGLAVGFNATGQNDPDRYARRFMSNAPVTMDSSNGRTQLISAGVISEGSHGAIGGLPWVERREDQQAVNTAATTLNSWLSANGINAHVRDKSYTPSNLKTFPQVYKPEYVELQKMQKAAQQSYGTPW